MDFNIYLRFMFALILVLGLIGALTWAARRFGFGGQLTPNAGSPGSRWSRSGPWIPAAS
jgi:hypothetical protein